MIKEALNVFEQDIFMQPQDLRESLAFYKKENYYNKMEALAKSRYGKIIFTGMGSSYSACINPSKVLSNHGIRCQAVVTSDLLYYQMDMLEKDDLVIMISQSGESGEIADLIRQMDSDIHVAAFTNNQNSALGKRGKECFLLNVRDELAVSTRTYLSSIILLYMLQESFLGTEETAVLHDIETSLQYLEAAVNEFDNMTAAMEKHLGVPPYITLLGRGFSYETADAGGLFVKEVAKYPSIPMESGQFRHGPFEMVVSGLSALIFAPRGAGMEMQFRLAADLAERGAKIVLITDSDTPIDNPGVLVLRQNYVNEQLACLVNIVPVQCFGNYVAKSKGIKVGEFVYGSKITVIQ